MGGGPRQRIPTRSLKDLKKEIDNKNRPPAEVNNFGLICGIIAIFYPFIKENFINFMIILSGYQQKWAVFNIRNTSLTY
jgi:hypothetical protein